MGIELVIESIRNNSPKITSTMDQYEYFHSDTLLFEVSPFFSLISLFRQVFAVFSDGRNSIEIYSTVDMNLTETSFLTFQLDRNTCSKNSSKVLPKDSPWDLEYSIDYGQTWASIDRPSTATSNPTDIIIRQPLQSISNDTFVLSLYAYLPFAKYINFLSFYFLLLFFSILT